MVDGIQGLIVDAAEENLMRLTAKSFRLCGSDGSKNGENVQVAEAMQLLVI